MVKLSLQKRRIPKNVWLGASTENQKRLEERITQLLFTQAKVKFLSIEPMLGRVDLNKVDTGIMEHKPSRKWDRPVKALEEINWVIIGCESNGKKVGRLGEFGFERNWIDGAISIVDQCKAANVPVFVKQIPINGEVEKDISKFPAQLQFREWPVWVRGNN